jgi:hypothetical protein
MFYLIILLGQNKLATIERTFMMVITLFCNKPPLGLCDLLST